MEAQYDKQQHMATYWTKSIEWFPTSCIHKIKCDRCTHRGHRNFYVLFPLAAGTKKKHFKIYTSKHLPLICRLLQHTLWKISGKLVRTASSNSKPNVLVISVMPTNQNGWSALTNWQRSWKKKQTQCSCIIQLLSCHSICP